MKGKLLNIMQAKRGDLEKPYMKNKVILSTKTEDEANLVEELDRGSS